MGLLTHKGEQKKKKAPFGQKPPRSSWSTAKAENLGRKGIKRPRRFVPQIQLRLHPATPLSQQPYGSMVLEPGTRDGSCTCRRSRSRKKKLGPRPGCTCTSVRGCASSNHRHRTAAGENIIALNGIKSGESNILNPLSSSFVILAFPVSSLIHC